MDWRITIRCFNGHEWRVPSPLATNVDGHAVLPLPSACPTCSNDATHNETPRRRLTARQVRKLERAFRQELRDL